MSICLASRTDGPDLYCTKTSSTGSVSFTNRDFPFATTREYTFRIPGNDAEFAKKSKFPYAPNTTWSNDMKFITNKWTWSATPSSSPFTKMTSSPFEVKGTVVIDAKPVSGVSITLIEDGLSNVTAPTATTSASGEFTFSENSTPTIPFGTSKKLRIDLRQPTTKALGIKFAMETTGWEISTDNVATKTLGPKTYPRGTQNVYNFTISVQTKPSPLTTSSTTNSGAQTSTSSTPTSSSSAPSTSSSPSTAASSSRATTSGDILSAENVDGLAGDSQDWAKQPSPIRTMSNMVFYIVIGIVFVVLVLILIVIVIVIRKRRMLKEDRV